MLNMLYLEALDQSMACYCLNFWVIKALKCEVVNFPKFKLAGIPIRPFKYLDAPILIIARVPCMCSCDVHAHHDITGFAYDVNHVTMTSPAFPFHSCNVEIMWHDVTGVHIVGKPHQFSFILIPSCPEILNSLVSSGYLS